MSNLYIKNLVRFIFITLLQVLVLKHVEIKGSVFSYIHLIFYPVFLMLLPIRLPKSALILIGVFLGLILDIFYDTPGIHTSACVFTAYIRPFILQVLEPRGGYNVNDSPTKNDLGFRWFIGYASIMEAAHLLFYFSVEEFTFVYIGSILLKTFLSFIFSMILIIMYKFLFNPQ